MKNGSQKRIAQVNGTDPWRITFDTNPDTCNLHCMMCEEHSNHRNTLRPQQRLMDIAIIQKVVESVAPHGIREIIPSTMGEPLLYPHFDKIISLVRQHDLKLNLTTNGTFPGRGVDEWAGIILPVASDVKISINGATKETGEAIMCGINFEKQVWNIERFIEVRDEIRRKKSTNHPTVTFQVTYLERNLVELPDMLRMAIDMGADRFKGHHLWITWPELENESLQRNPESRGCWNRVVQRLMEIAEAHRLPDGSKIVLDNVYPISGNGHEGGVPHHWQCPFLGREAWIAWDGTFNVCCSPDALRRTLGDFGNVTENDFMDLWTGKRYRELVRNWGSYDVCRKCNMRKPSADLMGCT